jgi:hypothetical protein
MAVNTLPRPWYARLWTLLTTPQAPPAVQTPPSTPAQPIAAPAAADAPVVRSRQGIRVTLYLKTGITIQGILVATHAADYEVALPKVAAAGSTQFRAIMHPVAVPLGNVDFMTLERE